MRGMKADEKIKLLEKTRDMLEERGWAQETLVSVDTGRCCMLGAIGLAFDNADRDVRLIGTMGMSRYLRDLGLEAELLDVASELFGKQYSISGFNDMPGRTYGHVINVIDETIARLKESLDA